MRGGGHLVLTIRTGMKDAYNALLPLRQPGPLASAVLNRLAYGGAAYGRPASGTPDSLAAMTRDQIDGFHDRWWRPDNAVLVIVGDLTPEEGFALADFEATTGLGRGVIADADNAEDIGGVMGGGIAAAGASAQYEGSGKDEGDPRHPLHVNGLVRQAEQAEVVYC